MVELRTAGPRPTMVEGRSMRTGGGALECCVACGRVVQHSAECQTRWGERTHASYTRRVWLGVDQSRAAWPRPSARVGLPVRRPAGQPLPSVGSVCPSGLVYVAMHRLRSSHTSQRTHLLSTACLETPLIFQNPVSVRWT